MSTSITIRNVPDETRDELAARASRSGRSLQGYLRAQMIELASKPDIDSLLQRIVDRKESTRTVLTTDEILEYRDADRR